MRVFEVKAKVNTATHSLVSIVNDPQARMTKTMAAFTGENIEFILCLASTYTSEVEGISAAGATPALRRLTPAVDGEVLVTGRALSCPELPKSPVGIVSPVVITRACLRSLGIQPEIIDCGAFVPPQVQHRSVNRTPAQCVSTGESMPLLLVQEIFRKGAEYGRLLSSKASSLIVSECVPAGTTTALAVLSALGYEVRSSLSSSVPQSNHEARWSLVQEGLNRARLKSPNCFEDPLQILAAVGDPMQPFVLGLVTASMRACPIILAGGSQMLALYAILKRYAELNGFDLSDALIGVVTTKWVAFDQSARLVELCAKIGAPFAASCPDFSLSRHPGLQAYEQGNVKEGVGAGAAMAIQFGRVSSVESTMHLIDEMYDELLSR